MAAVTDSEPPTVTEGKTQDVVSSTVPPQDLTLLRRTTRVSVASELLRSSVRYARHLAEAVVDDPVAVTGASGVGIAGEDDDGEVGGKSPNRAVDAIFEITNQERWGGSTDGIADTSGGGGGGGTNDGISKKKNRPRAPLEHGAGATDAPVAAEATIARPPAAVAERARTRGGPNASQPVIARVVGETLRLAREAPPMLARALASLAGEGGTEPDRGREKESQPIPGRGCPAAGLPRERQGQGSAPSAAAAAAAAVVEEPRNHRWVLTGVVEALMLAESLVATTTLTRFPAGMSETSHRDDWYGCLTDIGGGEQMQSSTPPASPSTPPAAAARVVAGKAGGETSASFAGSRKAQEGAGAENSAARSARLLLIERQLELLHEQALSTAGGVGWSATPTATFVVPYSWGSMSLLNAPTRFEGHKEGSGGNHGRGRNARRGELKLGDFQNCWRAVRLDRLLSSRVVRALPGYVGALPPQRNIGMVPILLRWLEVQVND